MRFSRGVSRGIVSRKKKTGSSTRARGDGAGWGRRSVRERSRWRDKEGARGGGWRERKGRTCFFVEAETNSHCLRGATAVQSLRSIYHLLITIIPLVPFPSSLLLLFLLLLLLLLLFFFFFFVVVVGVSRVVPLAPLLRCWSNVGRVRRFHREPSFCSISNPSNDPSTLRTRINN